MAQETRTAIVGQAAASAADLPVADPAMTTRS